MLSTDLALRPYFWNVPLWAQIGLYVLGILAMGIFIAGVLRSRKILKDGFEKDAASPVRLSWAQTASTILLQRKVRETASGKAHFGIFWGFLLLFVGTALATIDWDIAWLLFDKRILSGRFYLIYKLTLDLAGLAALAGLTYAAFRRFIFDDPRVEPTSRAAIIIGSLAAIILLGYAVEALRLAAENPPWAIWSPVGYLLSHCFSGMGPEALRTTHIFLWVIHALTALCFVAVIPLTFYAHMFKTPASVRREKAAPRSAICKIEDIENQEHFGVSDFKQFSLEDRFHIDGCTECGRCRGVCPAFRAGSVLDPKGLMVTLKTRLSGERKDEPLIEGLVKKEALWDCTTCGACAEVCPARIPIPDLVISMRRHLALEQGEFAKGVAGALENAGSVGNPWGMDPGSRTHWCAGLDVPIAKPGEHYEVLYWVGCSASYDKRAQKVARAMIKILKAAGVSFAIMQEERCHADWARRAGEEYLFQTAAAENIENLSHYDFERILAVCPHCYNTLKHEYPQFKGGRFTVIGHVEFILELLKGKRLELKGKLGEKVVLHDACYLARANRLVREPRLLLKDTGATVLEPAERGLTALCCGAGGSQLFSENRTRIHTIRIEELKATGAQRIAVECPHCMTMLTSAKGSGDIPIEDIAEIVASHLNPPETSSCDK